MAHISCAKITIHWITRVLDPRLSKRCAQKTEQFVKTGPATYCHVVNLVQGSIRDSGRSQQVGLNRIADVAEVTTCLTVPIDEYIVATNHRRGPGRDNCRVGTRRVLASPKDIEVP